MKDVEILFSCSCAECMAARALRWLEPDREIPPHSKNTYLKGIRLMEKGPQLTVSELIDILQALPNQKALVDIAMNWEYQRPLRAAGIRVERDNLVVIED